MGKINKIIGKYSEAERGVPASERDIEKFARSLGIRVPGIYVEFLRECGWVACGSEEILGYSASVPVGLSALEKTLWYRSEPWHKLPRDYIAVHDNGAGDIACLDLLTSDGRECAVSVYLHETGSMEREGS